MSIFSHCSLRPHSENIRVFTLFPGEWCTLLQCHLETASSYKDVKYNAISYAWGNVEETRRILVNSAELQIPSNLEAALRHLRKQNESISLWADFICVNQKDALEKSSQVAMMGKIFQNSLSTYIWLGIPKAPILDDSAYWATSSAGDGKWVINKEQTSTLNDMNPFTVVHQFAADGHFNELPWFKTSFSDEGSIIFQQTPLFKSVWDAFDDFRQRSWWTRLWCVQEALLPHTAIIIFGKWRLPLGTLKTAEVNHKKHSLDCCSETVALLPERCFYEPDQIVLSMHPKVRDGTRLLRQLSIKELSSNLDKLLRIFMYKSCLDPRDKVYGIIGMISTDKGISILPDYTLDAETVFTNLMISLLENSVDLRALTGLGFNTKELNIPSWVRNYALCPDPQHVRWETTRYEAYSQYSASRDLQAAPRLNLRGVLTLSGVFVEKVDYIADSIQTRSRSHIWKVLRNWFELAGLEDHATIADYVQIKRSKGRIYWQLINNIWALLQRWFELNHPISIGSTLQWKKFKSGIWLHFWRVFRNWLNFFAIWRLAVHHLAGIEPSAAIVDFIQIEAFNAEDYWRTIMGDCVLEQPHGETWRRLHRDEIPNSTAWIPKMVDAFRKKSDYLIGVRGRSFSAMTHGRAMFITKEGSLGLCYPEVKPGDEVWVLCGGRVPFILRPCKKLKDDRDITRMYNFLGECYLNGYMDGEALDIRQLQLVHMV